MTIGLGYIDFLNSLPVYLALENGAVSLPDGVELVRGVPSELNARQAKGGLPVSQVSSIHFAQHADDLVLVPGISINTRGFVHSVELFYRHDLDTLDGGRIMVTTQSATSEVLLRILLERRFGVEASIIRGTPDLDLVGDEYDGALLIGDDALHGVRSHPNLGRRDLGLEWMTYAGHPMVFAVWAADRAFAEEHPGTLAGIRDALHAARRWGREHRADVVDEARRRSTLPRNVLDRYFRHLDYELDAGALKGLAAYYEHARELGDLDRVPSLEVVA